MKLQEKMQEILNEFKMQNLDERDKEVFQKILPLVFSQSFVKKIFQRLSGLTIKRMASKKDIAAYQQGKTIYINMPYFEGLNGEQKTRYLLHEFLHILQMDRKFKEVKEVSLKLYRLVRRDLDQKSLSKLLTGKDGQEKYINKWEVLTYLMNGKVNMNILPEKTKANFLDILEESEIFNLNTTFWKKILR